MTSDKTWMLVDRKPSLATVFPSSAQSESAANQPGPVERAARRPPGCWCSGSNPHSPLQRLVRASGWWQVVQGRNACVCHREHDLTQVGCNFSLWRRVGAQLWPSLESHRPSIMPFYPPSLYRPPSPGLPYGASSRLRDVVKPVLVVSGSFETARKVSQPVRTRLDPSQSSPDTRVTASSPTTSAAAGDSFLRVVDS